MFLLQNTVLWYRIYLKVGQSETKWWKVVDFLSMKAVIADVYGTIQSYN